MAGSVVQGFRKSSLYGNGRAKCRVDSVKHGTSPSRRENVATSNQITSVSKPVCRCRTSACSTAAPPRIPVCRPQHVHELRVPNRCLAGQRPIPPCLVFQSGARLTRAPHRETQTQNDRSHIAMSYQLSFAWKASLTRTPPPICTSALGSHTALVRRASGVANGLQIHHR